MREVKLFVDRFWKEFGGVVERFGFVVRRPECVGGLWEGMYITVCGGFEPDGSYTIGVVHEVDSYRRVYRFRANVKDSPTLEVRYELHVEEGRGFEYGDLFRFVAFVSMVIEMIKRIRDMVLLGEV